MIGDRDTHLMASMMQTLRKLLTCQVRLPPGYHPQTDAQTKFPLCFYDISGHSERVSKQLSTAYSSVLVCLPQHYVCLPQHIVHFATGYPPQRLLFGWCPWDLRSVHNNSKAPLSTVEICVAIGAVRSFVQVTCFMSRSVG